MRTQKTDAPSLSLLPSAQAFAKARVFSLFLQPLGFGTELKTDHFREQLKQKQRNDG